LNLVTLTVLALVAPRFSYGNSITVSGTSNTSNQSMWGPGSSFSFNYNGQVETPSFTGQTGNMGTGTGCFAGVCAGYDAYMSTSAIAGLNVGFGVNSGTVNAAVPVSIDLGAPSTAKPGANFNVTAGGFTFGSGSLSTVGSTVSADAEFFYSAAAGLYGKYCYITGCDTYGSFNDIYDHFQGLELLGFNRDNDGQLRLLGYNYSFAGVPIGTSFPISDYGSFQINYPSGPNTSGGGTSFLTSSNVSDLASMTLNVGNLGTLLGLPPLDSDVDVYKGIIGAEYKLLQPDVTLSFSLSQSFAFAPSPSLFLDVQETGQIVPLGPNGSASVFFPAGDTELHITPVIDMGGMLSNNMGLCIHPTMDVTGIEFNLKVAGDSVGLYGPLFQYSHDFGCFGDTSISDQAFNLAGFSQIIGSTFTVSAQQSNGQPADGQPSAVPEPATWMVCASTVGIALLIRFRRNGLQRRRI
jgi:hypothetical protein